LAYPALQEQGLRALGNTTHKEVHVLSVSPIDEKEAGGGTLPHCSERSIAAEGVEGVVEVHLNRDALLIGKHARMMGRANTAAASWHAHSHLEGVEPLPCSAPFHGSQAGEVAPNLFDVNKTDTPSASGCP
jgi:hypothetical protein